MSLPGHPIISCAAARALESRLFGNDEAREWEAMSRAGAAIGRAVLDDIEEIGGFPADGRILVLAGKGHNGGDALLAAETILRARRRATVDVIFALGHDNLRPLAKRAVEQLQALARGRVRIVVKLGSPRSTGSGRGYDVCLDGVFGFQFRTPVPARVLRLFARVEAMPVRFRAAVDLPSGFAFKADFTYATGSVKLPVVDPRNAEMVGRLRYLDLGFFKKRGSSKSRPLQVLTDDVLDPLRKLRNPRFDKRANGHLFIVAGSLSYPGAALLCVRAALGSGVGLVTAFVPERFVAAFAARVPGAIWVGFPTNAAGGLSKSGVRMIEERISRASAIAIGPGMGSDAETLAAIRTVVGRSKVPLVIDADALRPEIVRAGSAPRILTPHAGELSRIGTIRKRNVVLVKKGPLTAIQVGKDTGYSPFGGPVLARGGSGDILTGIIGGILAQRFPLAEAAAMGVVWHSSAADLLARRRGSVSVKVDDLLGFMGPVLRRKSG